jgi:hypothetical protein
MCSKMVKLLHVRLTASIIRMTVRTSETSVDNHFTRQYIPEDYSEHHILCYNDMAKWIHSQFILKCT